MIWLPYVWAVLSELGLVEVVRQRVMQRYGVDIPEQLPGLPEGSTEAYYPSEYDPDVDPYYWNLPDDQRNPGDYTSSSRRQCGS